MLIYKATSTISNKVYVGCTRFSLEKRIKSHIKYYNFCHNRHFYHAIKKYGVSDFEWEILENNIKTTTQLHVRETYWIKKLDSFHNGYNMTEGGEGCKSLNV